MIYTVYLPLLAVLILAGLAPVLGRRLSPAAATQVLGAVAGVAATATLTTLLLLGIGGALRPMALAGWGLEPDTARALLAADSVPWPLGAAAMLLLAAAVVRTLRVIRGERAALNDLQRVAACSSAQRSIWKPSCRSSCRSAGLTAAASRETSR
jgi:hypothetical protein